MSVSQAVLDRLEAITARLEAYASGLGAPAASSGRQESKSASPRVSAFDAFYSGSVQPFITACGKFPETAKIGEQAEAAFKNIRSLMVATGECKKPSDANLQKFIAPVFKVCGDAQNVDNRSAFFNQMKSWAEAVQSFNWLLTTPKPHILDGLEAADFYLNKILVAAKAKSGEEADNMRSFVTSMKAMLTQEDAFACEFFKMGLEWNMKGGDLASFTDKSSAPSSDAGAPDAPPPPAPEDIPMDVPSESKSSAPGGMAAVFDSINAGNVTAGLKKVTKDMKTKYRTDNTPLEPKKTAPAPKATPAPSKAAPKAEPKLHLTKGTWFVENYTEDAKIPEVESKQNVYILKAKNCTITVPEKCKAIQVDGCERLNLVFKSVVSLCEVFNSKRCNIEGTDAFPSVQIDKSSGISVILSRAGLANPPTIVTSNVSELNLVIPGAKDEDDPIEIPLPEQYTTVLKNGKLETTPVAHSGA